MAEDENATRRRAHQPRDRADQRRLAGTIQPQQPEEHARGEAQLERVQGVRAVGVDLGQPIDEACGRRIRHVPG